MPTYDYECTSCGNRFEAFQKISDAPLDKCPKCKKKVKRLISAGLGIIFKGSGFYSTDSKKSSSASLHTKDKPADASATDAASKTESNVVAAQNANSSGKDKPKKDDASRKDARVTA